MAEVAHFRVREEALEVYERRLLVREERRLKSQQRIIGRLEIGERRLALIGRIVLLAVSIVFALASVVLYVLGHLAAGLAGAAGFSGPALVALVVTLGRKSGHKPQE